MSRTNANSQDGAVPARKHNDVVVQMFTGYLIRRGREAALAAARGGAFGRLTASLLNQLEAVADSCDDAVGAERRRVAALEARALPGDEQLLAEAKASDMTLEEFQARQQATRGRA